ncbi:MAG: HlyD family efflux transporter periplasmic adaptor subunit [Puniceicoccales bacterium]|nr:HlyD family efflux transporter periplasmic adaptor subunit [Puniceicoccales bacterium]
MRAPFKGRVLRVFARTGEAVGPAGVAEIADLSQMTVEAEVNVADIARVRLGAKAVVSLPGRKESFAGKVAAIGLRVVAGALADDNPAAFKDQRVVPVVVELDAAASAALSGLSAAQAQVRISGE